MNKSKFILGLFLAIFCIATACNVLPKGADGYFFETKEWNAQVMVIETVEHKSLEDIKNEYYNITGIQLPDNVTEFAFTRIDKKDGTPFCKIHIIDPAVHYAPEFIGHEFVHCKYGRFHESQTMGH